MSRTFGGTAVVLSIVTCVLSVFIIPFMPTGVSWLYVLAALAIILAIIGFIKDDPKGVAILGFVLGILAIVLIVIGTNIWQMILP
jgi:hypothetical protein